MPRHTSALLRHIGFVLAALAVLMGSIDGTIVVVALPQLKESLNTSLSWVGWTLTSYQLVQIVMYPLAGKVSDVLGRRRVFLFCVITFTLSSLLCGLAPNVGVLIVFRALQAIGGGGIRAPRARDTGGCDGLPTAGAQSVPGRQRVQFPVRRRDDGLLLVHPVLCRRQVRADTLSERRGADSARGGGDRHLDAGEP